MFTQAHREVWVAAHDDLRRAVGEERFTRWIAPLKVLSQGGEEIRLGVPNRFVLDWIEKRYVPRIMEVLRERLGKELRLSLVIDAELYRERREAAEGIRTSGVPATAESGPVENGRAGGSGSGLRQVAPASSSSALDMTLESFVVGPSNRLAFNAALQLLDSPGNLYNPFFVHGPPGVGKTHLLKGLCHAFRHRRRGPKDVARSPSGVETTAGQGFACRVRYLSGEQFFNQFAASVQDGTVRKFRERYRSLDVLIVDDVHLLVNKKKTQVEFLHTFNSLAETGRQVILASDAPPKSLGDLDRGLVGRFLSGLVVGIKKPDYETRLGIASMQARRFTTRFDESVLRFLAERVRGSARELIGAMKQVDIHAQLNGGALSLRQAEEALAELIREEERRVTLSRIVVVVAAHFRLSPEVLVSPSRQRHVALARQTGMFLARQYTGKSLGEIGKHFGNRNHTTVRCALAKVERLLTQSGDRLVWEISQIRETLEQ